MPKKNAPIRSVGDVLVLGRLLMRRVEGLNELCALAVPARCSPKTFGVSVMNGVAGNGALMPMLDLRSASWSNSAAGRLPHARSVIEITLPDIEYLKFAGAPLFSVKLISLPRFTSSKIFMVVANWQQNQRQ